MDVLGRGAGQLRNLPESRQCWLGTTCQQWSRSHGKPFRLRMHFRACAVCRPNSLAGKFSFRVNLHYVLWACKPNSAVPPWKLYFPAKKLGQCPLTSELQAFQEKAHSYRCNNHRISSRWLVCLRNVPGTVSRRLSAMVKFHQDLHECQCYQIKI